jgi:hypothetical protein
VYCGSGGSKVMSVVITHHDLVTRSL